MSELTWTLETETQPEDSKALHEILRAANHAASDLPPNWQTFHILLRDAKGAVVGGIKAHTGWDCLTISILALAPSLRGKGYGTQLLAQAEAEGVRRGCRFAHLDTFDFQALPFYQKRGYEIFGTLDGYAGGHTQYFVKKLLPASAEDSAL